MYPGLQVRFQQMRLPTSKTLCNDFRALTASRPRSAGAMDGPRTAGHCPDTGPERPTTITVRRARPGSIADPAEGAGPWNPLGGGGGFGRRAGVVHSEV